VDDNPLGLTGIYRSSPGFQFDLHVNTDDHILCLILLYVMFA